MDGWVGAAALWQLPLVALHAGSAFARPWTAVQHPALTCVSGCLLCILPCLQTSNPDVYAIGDVAAFPLKLTGVTTRQEHVTCCRWGEASLGLEGSGPGGKAGQRAGRLGSGSCPWS